MTPKATGNRCACTTPVMIAGKAFTAVKPTATERHLLAPSELARSVDTILPKIGVTRLANITGLDRIGVPVFLAIRPNSKGVATNAGKGLTRISARVSASMESIERYHVENVTPDILRATHREVSAKRETIPPEKLPLRKGCRFDVDWPHDWLIGWDLMGACEVAVPFSMISIVPPAHAYDFPIFHSNTIGVGAGSHILEAIVEGICEVIEHDAITCDRYWSPRKGGCRYLDTTRLPEAALPLVEMLERADVRLMVTDCTNDTDVPSYEAWVYDDVASHIGAYYGQASHLSCESAMCAAILEAVQARAVYIAGSRDDYCQDELKLLRSLGPASRHTASTMRPIHYASAATPTLEGDIAVLLRKLRSIDVEQVIVCDLTREDINCPVVKVIVPGLEGSLTDKYVPGHRALKGGRQ